MAFTFNVFTGTFDVVSAGGGTLTGGGASPQVAFWSGPTALDGDLNFNWTGSHLLVNTLIAADLVDAPLMVTGSAGRRVILTDTVIVTASATDIQLVATATPFARFRTGLGGVIEVVGGAFSDNGDGTRFRITNSTNIIELSSAFAIRWSDAATFSGGTKDIGLRRTGVGILDVTNGAAGQGTANAAAFTAVSGAARQLALANGSGGRTSFVDSAHAASFDYTLPSVAVSGTQVLSNTGDVLSWATATGGVASVTEGTLTGLNIAPTTGAVVADLDIANLTAITTMAAGDFLAKYNNLGTTPADQRKILFSDFEVAITAGNIGGGAALTRVDDTNVTLVLGGTPTTALLKATSLTLGWAGTLAAARLNSNVVQAVVNDTNVTGAIAAQALTLGWTGTAAAARLNANVVQAITNDTNVTGSIAAQNLTLGWTGTLSAARGGTGLGALGAADAFLAMDAAGTALEYKSLSSVGGTVRGLVRNTAGSGASHAVLHAHVDAGTTGDAYTRFTTGGTEWSAGVDTTDTSYKIHNSTTLPTTPLLELTPTGELLLGVGTAAARLHAQQGISATPLAFLCRNIGAGGAASTATIIADAATAGGDSQFQCQGAGSAEWTFGYDNDGAGTGPFVLSLGATLGTTNRLSVNQTAPTAGTFLRSDATQFVQSTLTIPDTGSANTAAFIAGAANVVTFGTLPINAGGTGQITATAAFNALDPLTTLGDILFHNGTDSVRLAGNIIAAKQFLTQTGTGAVSAAPIWGALATTDYPLTVAEDGSSIATDAIRIDFRDTDTTVVTDVGTDARVSLQGYGLLAGRSGGQSLAGGSPTTGAATDTLSLTSRAPAGGSRPGIKVEPGTLVQNIGAGLGNLALFEFNPTSFAFNDNLTDGQTGICGFRLGGTVQNVGAGTAAVLTRGQWFLRANNVSVGVPGFNFVFEVCPEILNTAATPVPTWPYVVHYASRIKYKTNGGGGSSQTGYWMLYDGIQVETTTASPFVVDRMILAAMDSSNGSVTATGGNITVNTLAGMQLLKPFASTASGNITIPRMVDVESNSTFTGAGTSSVGFRVGHKVGHTSATTLTATQGMIGFHLASYNITLNTNYPSVSFSSADATAHLVHNGTISSIKNKGGLTLNPIVTPGTPSVVVVGLPGGQTYTYKIYAKTLSGRTILTAAVSTGAAARNDLTAGDFNRVSWTQVDGATSYVVVRFTSTSSIPPENTLGEIGEVFAWNGEETLRLDDVGQATTAGIPTITENTTANFLLNGSLQAKVASGLAYPYTVLVNDCIVQVDTTAARTINLPAAATAGAGKLYVIKDEDGTAGANAITVDGSGAETIDGALTKLINTNYGAMWLYSTGTNWLTV